MAVIRQITAQQGIDVGGIPNTRVDDSAAQGLRAVGGAVQDAGQVMHEMAMRRDRMAFGMQEFETDQGSRRFDSDMALDFAKVQQDIAPSGQGFTERVSSTFNQRADEFLKTVPSALRPKYEQLFATRREQWVNKAAATEIDQRNTWYRDGITKTHEKLQGDVFNDPALFDAAKDDGYRAIDASGLPQAEKQKWREAWDQTLAVTVGERDVRDAEADPMTAESASRRLGVGPSVPLPKAVQDRANLARDHFVKLGYTPEQAAGIVGNLVQESSVQSDGPSGDSGSAHGIAQWRGERFTKLQRFANARGRDWRDFKTQLDFIDVELQQDETAAYSRLKNAKTIEEATAAFIGFERPRGWSTKSPQAGHGWANRLAAAQRTAGVEVTASGPIEVDPRYASLSLAKRLEIYDNIQAAAQRGQTATNAQATAAYDSHKGALELGIQTGEVASLQTILSDPVLKDADKATLFSALRTRQGDAMATGEAVRLFGQGALSVDPYDSQGKKTVDNVWTAVSQNVPPDQLQPTLENIVRQTGTVPQSALNQIRAGLTSQDLSTLTQAAQSAQRIAAVDPAALSRRDGGGEVQKAADDFSFYVDRLNLSPEEAAKRMAEKNSPEKQFTRKAIEPAAKEFVKGLQGEDVAALFDESFGGWRSNPALGYTPAQALGIQAEFLAIAEDAFYATNGDPELAKNRAVSEMKRLYGVTEFGGANTVVKHPPERYWPQQQDPGGYLGIGADPLQYAKTQLHQDITGMSPDYQPGSIQLVTTPETDAMVKRGEMPGYAVLWKDKDGVLQTLPGKLWRPDPAMMQKNEASRMRERADDARNQHETIREDVQQRYPEGLDGPERFGNGELNYGVARRNSPLGRAIERRRQEDVKSQLQDQRKQLFNDAEDSGMVPTPGSAM